VFIVAIAGCRRFHIIYPLFTVGCRVTYADADVYAVDVDIVVVCLLTTESSALPVYRLLHVHVYAYEVVMLVSMTDI
jgi:hypothetical protein